MKSFSIRTTCVLALAGGLGLLALPEARATEISEYFNDYGTSNVSLVGLNGGTGWNSAWAGNTVNFVPGSEANYSATGYSGLGNQNDANDGSAGGTGTGTVAYRTFAPLTGTIWITLTLQQSVVGQDVLFWLDKNATNGALTTPRNFVALRGSTGTATDGSNPTKIPEPILAYNGGDDGTNNLQFAVATPHLMLVKIDMNYSAALDRVSLWIDPDLSGGQAGLGLTVGSTNGPLYSKGTADTFLTDFEGIGISTTGATNVVDAIRISDDPDGFGFVATGVPEPSSAALACLGVMVFSRRMRRKNTTRVTG